VASFQPATSGTVEAKGQTSARERVRGPFRIAACAATICLSGCSDLPVTLEVLTWWQESSEKSALDALVNEHRKRRPNAEVHSPKHDTSEETREQINHRMLLGEPPSTFQSNIGSDLLRWAAVDYTLRGQARSESRILDLTEFYDARGLREIFYPRLLAELSFRGEENDRQLFGVPLNIHRLNVLYYNRERTRPYIEAGLDFTRRLDVLCPEEPIDWNGMPPPVIAMGAGSPFSLTLLTFENVLPAIAGAEAYEHLWRGEQPDLFEDNPPEGRYLRRALDCVLHLSQFFEPRHLAGTWAAAADLVANGGATFTVMGDWVNGRHSTKLVEGELVSEAFPGTEDIFVFTSDTLPLPYGVISRNEVEEFLATAATRAAQREFSRIKGSIPARRDLPVDGEITKKTQRAFESAKHVVLATSGIFPPYFPTQELETRLSGLIANRDVDGFIAWLRTRYGLLSLWRDRLEKGPGELPR